jgi:hypothetical protein
MAEINTMVTKQTTAAIAKASEIAAAGDTDAAEKVRRGGRCTCVVCDEDCREAGGASPHVACRCVCPRQPERLDETEQCEGYDSEVLCCCGVACAWRAALSSGRSGASCSRPRHPTHVLVSGVVGCPQRVPH